METYYLTGKTEPLGPRHAVPPDSEPGQSAQALCGVTVDVDGRPFDRPGPGGNSPCWECQSRV